MMTFQCYFLILNLNEIYVSTNCKTVTKGKLEGDKNVELNTFFKN